MDGSQYTPFLHHPQMILNNPISFMDPTMPYLTIAIYWPIALDLHVTATAVLPEEKHNILHDSVSCLSWQDVAKGFI